MFCNKIIIIFLVRITSDVMKYLHIYSQFTQCPTLAFKKLNLIRPDIFKIIILISFCLHVSEAPATNYYLSSDGNDNNSGISMNKAWKTVSKLNREFPGFKPGDSILFKRGNTFNGPLVIGASGQADKHIIISAYGTGPDPVITGLYSVDNLNKAEEKGIYSALIPQKSMLNLVLFNNENIPSGRWPNNGWLKINSHNGKNSITDQSLHSQPDWTGAEIVVRTRTWVLDKRKIILHKKNTLIFDPLFYEPVNGSGYYIQNHPKTLDRQGEWSFDGKTFMIYLGTELLSERPQIKLPIVDNLLSIIDKSYVTIENIQFTGANVNGCIIRKASNVIIRNCSILLNGRNGIYAYDGCRGLLLEKNYLSDNNNSGIYISTDSQYSIIKNNNINKSGYLQGMGTYADDSYSGIVCQGDYSLITLNKIENSGYIGIRWGGQNSEVSYNYVNSTCLWKDDGGGIYTFSDESTGKVVKNNIVLNAKARPDGWHYYEDERAHGIYIDGSDNILLTGNTLAFNEGAGMYINEARNIKAEGNTCYDNKYGIMVTSMTGDTYARNLVIQKNIFYAVNKDNYNFFYATKKGKVEVAQFGSSDKNHFLTSRTDNKSIIVWINAWNWAPGDKTVYTLKEWKQTYGKDLNSKEYPDTIIEEYGKLASRNKKSLKVIARPFDSFSELDNYKYIFEYNTKNEIKIIKLDGNYIDLQGIKHSSAFSLQPFSSVLLFRLKEY